MNKNAAFIFATNLSDSLISRVNPFPHLVEAVLLSERKSTATSLIKIAKAKDQGSMIISDNGNFTRMSEIAKTFIAEGEQILIEAETQININGGVSENVLIKRSLLIKKIVNQCKLELLNIDFAKVISKQIDCDPEYLIGLEDYTIPVLGLARLLQPIFIPDPRDIRIFQKETLKLYNSEKLGVFGNIEKLGNIRKFIVLHSYDYSSAAQGAKLLSKEQVDGLAVGFGGPMTSKEFINSIKIRNKLEVFSESLPEPYILATAMLVGVTDGLNDKSLPIHILGLGSPILIILIGYLLRNNRAVSIDATSTFKDADDGTIYGSKKAFLKLDMFKVAAFSLINNEPYTSSSPYFKLFETKFPSNWQQMQISLSVTAESNINDVVAKLKQNIDLVEKHIPYFTPMRKGDDELIQELRIARSGSNYFLIQRICKKIRKLKGDEPKLKKWIFKELDRYIKNASPKWASAVSQIIQIMNKHKI